MQLKLNPEQYQNYRQLKQNSAYYELSHFKVIEVKGLDAATYLQTQLTNDTSLLRAGNGQFSALLDRKGHLQAHFVIYCLEDNHFWLLVETEQSQHLYHHLESFHFIEEVEVSLIQDYAFIWLQGPKSKSILAKQFNLNTHLDPLAFKSIQWNNQELFIADYSVFHQPGFLFLLEGSQKNTLLSLFNELNIPALDQDTYHTLRIEAGVPQYGLDMDQAILLPQTGLEKTHVSYAKGCYLGQEVVARIKTYGVVAQALIGLIFEGDYPAFNVDLIIEGKTKGQLKSSCYSPTLEKTIALIYLARDYREPGKQLTFEAQGKSYTAQVRLLPFVQAKSNTERADELYEQALTVFAEQNESEAIPLLEEAILLSPALADAYESLGVILSRQNRFEEAIEVMKQLTEIAPNLPMAHTNLSMFYMKIGDIPTAEKHLGEARRLELENQFKTQQANSEKAKAAQADRARKQEMIEMFKEVLEMEDPDDLIANFGLGKAYFDLENYGDAIPYLEKAIQIQPYYSVAYLLLGKCLEFTKQFEQANKTYQQGIIAASQKGDLMPLKEMEQRQLNLQH